MIRRWMLNPPMGQVIGGWFGAMIVLGIAGGWVLGPAEVRLHTVPPPSSRESSPEAAADALPPAGPEQIGCGPSGCGHVGSRDGRLGDVAAREIRSGQAGTSCRARIAGESQTSRSNESISASRCKACTSSLSLRWTSLSPHISSSVMRQPSPSGANCAS